MHGKSSCAGKPCGRSSSVFLRSAGNSSTCRLAQQILRPQTQQIRIYKVVSWLFIVIRRRASPEMFVSLVVPRHVQHHEVVEVYENLVQGLFIYLQNLTQVLLLVSVLSNHFFNVGDVQSVVRDHVSSPSRGLSLS